MADPGPDSQEYVKWLVGGSVTAAFTAWIKSRFTRLDALPALQHTVRDVKQLAENTEAKFNQHIEDIAMERLAYTQTMAKMQARQDAYENKQVEIIESVRALSQAITSGFAALTARIDTLMDRRKTSREQ